ncbi:hypothetical protein CEE57_03125 [Stenotrophomonas maltophilia]|nr:hypothetical protein CEE57_03125 [Stenotrophomonas maltophilia]
MSQGKAGKIEGGDRLPWVKTRGEDNYAISEQIGWQVHVYGRASTELKGWCDSRVACLARQVERHPRDAARDAALLQVGPQQGRDQNRLCRMAQPLPSGCEHPWRRIALA